MREMPNLEIKKQETRVAIEPGLVVPSEFEESPLRYFREHGLNIKSGETEYKEDGSIREDPTAVKCLPVWHDEEGEPMRVVAKKINPIKSQIGKSGNPWHEVDVMKRVKDAGLPVARLLAIAEDEGHFLFVTERVAGFTVYDTEMLDEKFRENHYTSEDIETLKDQVQTEMELLKSKLEEVGIIREKWKLQDMVFEIDFANRRVTKVTPVDWERTKLTHPEGEGMPIAMEIDPSKPVWEFPESLAFHQWYEDADKESEAYRQYLSLVALDQAQLPRYLASYRIQELRRRGLN